MFHHRLPLIFILGCFLVSSRAEEPALVGRVVEIKDQLLPGPELKVRKSQGLKDPLVLRITATYPHGTAGFRYDFSCVPMVAGKYDLTKFLESSDGQATKDLPPVLLEATGILPAGPPSFLKEAPIVTPPSVGGYRRLIPYGIALWIIAGGAVIWYFRRRKALSAEAIAQAPLSLAERLKPLLQRAIKEPLGTPEKAELERLLLAHGRERLGLTHATDPAVWQALRNNEATASWLTTLEGWLHRPASSPPSTKELQDLLALISTTPD